MPCSLGGKLLADATFSLVQVLDPSDDTSALNVGEAVVTLALVPKFKLSRGTKGVRSWLALRFESSSGAKDVRFQKNRCEYAYSA